MKNKIYTSPEISILTLEVNDVITTSDVELGVETPPTEVGGGSWETL